MSPQKMLVRDMHGWKSIPPNYAYDADFIEKLLEHPVLSERERDMLHRRYIDKQTLQDIGIEYLITRERVRQIIDKALNKLKSTKEGEYVLDKSPRYEFSGFNCRGLPIDADYSECMMPAGQSGIMSLYDEDSGQITLQFLRTQTRHKVGERAYKKSELGTALMGITFTDPEQLRIISDKLNLFANCMDMMRDPNTTQEERDILMGRKLI